MSPDPGQPRTARLQRSPRGGATSVLPPSLNVPPSRFGDHVQRPYSRGGQMKGHGQAIVLEGVTKQFGEHAAVREVSLEIGDGEFFSLLGPSGCGKTTTLRMIAGFVEPDAGRVQIGEREVTRLPPYRRDTGMVFQGYALFPHLTVAQNVSFGL